MKNKNLDKIIKTKEEFNKLKELGIVPMMNFRELLNIWEEDSHLFETILSREEKVIWEKDFVDNIDYIVYRGLDIDKDIYEENKDNFLEYLNSYHIEGINNYCSCTKDEDIAIMFSRLNDNPNSNIVRLVCKITGKKYMYINGINSFSEEDEKEVVVKAPIYESYKIISK